MSERRQVWVTLSTLLTQLEREVETALDQSARPDAALEDLGQQVRQLGKAQFKANALAEDQTAQWEKAITGLETLQEQRDQLVETVSAERVARREMELLEAVLPALDGLENAITSGRRYLQVRDRASSATTITPRQAVLVSPADRAVLAGWLEGLRLVRERLLAILEAGGVSPILTVGQPFDPYLHVAVGTSSEGSGPAGTIVAEERRGYRTANGVLRYAEVIVHRPSEARSA
ncbi:MAG TPA: nucleotide exchange factor GrpE [Chloroflexi bacterium]|nr:nucleotide exchange factor GrpE [Chloroflexota bacterium]